MKQRSKFLLLCMMAIGVMSAGCTNGVFHAALEGINKNMLANTKSLLKSPFPTPKPVSSLSDRPKSSTQPTAKTTSLTKQKSNTTIQVAPTIPPSRPTQVLLHFPAFNQNPELLNGCEVTSVSMMVNAAGHPADKMTLANMVKKDPAPLVRGSSGEIISWGDPNVGFVGDITGQNKGYSVYHGPVKQLVNQIMPGRAVDLTGDSFNTVLDQIVKGHPVVVWTNAHFSPESNWQTWQSENGPIRMTWNEHCVLLVGYDTDHVFINDPIDGTQAKELNKSDFVSSWQQMGSQAVSYN